MVISTFSAVFPKMELVSSNDLFFSTVKEQYREYIESGFFSEVATPAIYVYQIQRGKISYNGLIAGVAMDDYRNGKVKKHEKTLAPKEQRQLELMLHRKASVKPVLLAHEPFRPLVDAMNKRISRSAPLREVVFENETHRFWPIYEGEALLAQIEGYFADKIATTYIADGHHRFSAGSKMHEHFQGQPDAHKYDALMCALFPTQILEIHNFNRMVEAFEVVSPLVFMARLSHYGKVTPLREAQAPRKTFQLTFCIDSEWFLFDWDSDMIRLHADLGLPVMDVSLLNHFVLQDLLGIKDIRNDMRIQYLEGPKGLKVLERKGRRIDAISFCLHPLSWKEFFRVVNHGHILPPKSTWFEPRMKNGLIVQQFE